MNTIDRIDGLVDRLRPGVTFNMIIRAAKFAEAAHWGVTRKGGKVPYITHPGRIATRVTLHDIACETTICAAWLHDVLEDVADVSYQTLVDYFGSQVASLVQELTNPSKGSKLSREERKQMDRDHLKEVSKEAKIIKMFDRIDNIKEMAFNKEFSKKFLQTYASETKLLFECLRGVDAELEKEFEHELENFERRIERSEN